jgi:hypothetical protein
MFTHWLISHQTKVLCVNHFDFLFECTNEKTLYRLNGNLGIYCWHLFLKRCSTIIVVIFDNTVYRFIRMPHKLSNNNWCIKASYSLIYKYCGYGKDLRFCAQVIVYR